MFAVIKTGGKQYRVTADDVIKVEKLDAAAGDIVEIKDVLMVGGEGAPQIGAPLIADAAVAAEVVGQGRSAKVLVFKKKRRKNYRRKAGHRQHQTTLRITEILTGGKKPSKARAEARPAKPAAKADDKKADAKPAAKTSEKKAAKKPAAKK